MQTIPAGVSSRDSADRGGDHVLVRPCSAPLPADWSAMMARFTSAFLSKFPLS
jgi:hypothetical protein